jgi:hypothetical protein
MAIQNQIDDRFNLHNIDDIKIPHISQDVSTNILASFFGKKFSDFFRVGEAVNILSTIEMYTNPYQPYMSYENDFILLKNVSSMFHLLEDISYTGLDLENNYEDGDSYEDLKRLFEYEKSGKNWTYVRIYIFNEIINIAFYTDTLDFFNESIWYTQINIKIEDESYKQIRQIKNLVEKINNFSCDINSKTLSFIKKVKHYQETNEIEFI